MTNATLREYIGKRVVVRLFNNNEYEGVLGFTPEFSSKYNYRKPNYFTIKNLDFKVSHLKSIKVLD